MEPQRRPGRKAALCRCKHTKWSHTHHRKPTDRRGMCQAMGCECKEYVPANDAPSTTTQQGGE